MNDADSKNSDLKVKQQVIDKIKSSTNILVTVSRDPSVDDLTALIGLTALLNKLGKHATAIFSGEIPVAINFLDPEKIIENTADSLRDFIIALDKEKADHLRYKIEGDVVKIFITPYRTSISSNDLEFSQGDLNCELVLALGVENKDHLDAVLTAQNGLFHDVTIVTFSDGTSKSELGDIGWNDKDASCLSEMVVTVADALKTDKPILDKQISTALLTGIVAATNRFSNIRTTARVMAVSAQLMGFGADQQLIASKLSEEHEIQSLNENPGGGPTIETDKLNNPAELDIEQISTLPPVSGDNFDISHDEVAEPEANVSTLGPQVEESTLPQSDLSTPAPSEASQRDYLETESVLPQPGVEQAQTIISTLSPEDMIQNAIDTMPATTDIEPSLGGTLNATTEQAAEDARLEREKDQNTTILSHSYLDGSSSESGAGINSASQPSGDEQSVDIFDDPPQSTLAPDSFAAVPSIEPLKAPDMMPVEVNGLPMPPPLPDFSTLPPEPTVEFSIPAPTVPDAVPAFVPAPVASSTLAPDMNMQNNIAPAQPLVDDPSKFKIPGQF